MEAAVSKIAKGLSAGQDNLAGRCQRREFHDEPVLAVMCLAQMGAGGPMHVGVTNFREIACSKAQGQPGYICDYSFGVDLASGRNMGVLGEIQENQKTRLTHARSSREIPQGGSNLDENAGSELSRNQQT